MRRAFNAGQLFPIHVPARQDADAVAEWLIDRLSRLTLGLESGRKSRAMAASIWSASGLRRMALIDLEANSPLPTKIGSTNFVELWRLLHHLRVPRQTIREDRSIHQHRATTKSTAVGMPIPLEGGTHRSDVGIRSRREREEVACNVPGHAKTMRVVQGQHR